MTAFFLESATMNALVTRGTLRQPARRRIGTVIAVASLLCVGAMSHTPASAETVAPGATGSPTSAQVAARTIRRVYFGSTRQPETRAAGFVAIQKVDDPAGLLALADELSNEADDVRAVLVDHLAASGDPGRAVLAWLAITDDDAVLRGAAAQQLDAPVSDAVLKILREGLVHGTPNQIDRAAELAAWVGATDLLPILIQRLAMIRVVGRNDYRWGRESIVGISTVLSTEASSYGVIGQPFFTSAGVYRTAAPTRRSTRRVERPRPIVHRAVVALGRVQFGRDAPDFGYDRAAWFAWLDQITLAGPPRP